MSNLREIVEAKRLPPPWKRRELREAGRLTLAELAAQIEVSKTSVWLWERGERTPRTSNLVKYAAALSELERITDGR